MPDIQFYGLAYCEDCSQTVRVSTRLTPLGYMRNCHLHGHGERWFGQVSESMSSGDSILTSLMCPDCLNRRAADPAASLMYHGEQPWVALEWFDDER